MAETRVKQAKYKTRWCAQGWHEGDKPRTFLGNPAPTCKSPSEDCACSCHKKIDEMYALAEMPRELHNFSDYNPGADRLEMPDPVALERERAERLAASKSPDAPGAVVAGGHVFTPTETGIRGPGQLEYTVLDKLVDWLDPTFEVIDCTPKILAALIDPEPSTGAIHAVWVRWEKIGFARFQNRPAKFLGFVGSNKAQHLDELKIQAKHGKK